MRKALQTVPAYYWIVGLHEGKIVIIGPKLDEEEADRIGMEKFATEEYEVVNLPTRNEARATRMLKGRRLSSETLSAALEKVGHPGEVI